MMVNQLSDLVTISRAYAMIILISTPVVLTEMDKSVESLVLKINPVKTIMCVIYRP